MFDGIKIECNYLTNEWLNNDLLDFFGKVNLKTGELPKSTNVGVCRNLRFKHIPSQKYENTTYSVIEGSIHKFYNNGCNANDYSFLDVCNTIETLSNDFNIQPENSIIRNLEIGINLKLPITASKFIKMLVSMPTKRFSELSIDKVKLGKVCKLGDKEIKIYDKGKQAKKDITNLVRIEIRYKRMRELNQKYGIYTLADLTDFDKVKDLYKVLIDAFNDVIIYENNIDIESLSDAKQAQLYKYTNPLYWENLNRKQRYKLIRQYENVLSKFAPQNIKQNTLYSIVGKWSFLMELQHQKGGHLPQEKSDSAAPKRGTFATLEYRRKLSPPLHENIEQKNSPEFENILPEKSETKKRFCKTCNREITHQKKGSLFCSEKHFGKDAKRCRNKLSNQTRNKKQIEKREIEIKLLIELNKILPESNFNLLIYLKKEHGIKQQRKRQKDIKPIPYSQLRTIVKIKVFVNRKPFEFTTMRAKQLIKSIVIINEINLKT